MKSDSEIASQILKESQQFKDSNGKISVGLISAKFNCSIAKAYNVRRLLSSSECVKLLQGITGTDTAQVSVIENEQEPKIEQELQTCALCGNTTLNVESHNEVDHRIFKFNRFVPYGISRFFQSNAQCIFALTQRKEGQEWVNRRLVSEKDLSSEIELSFCYSEVSLKAEEGRNLTLVKDTSFTEKGETIDWLTIINHNLGHVSAKKKWGEDCTTLSDINADDVSVDMRVDSLWLIDATANQINQAKNQCQISDGTKTFIAQFNPRLLSELADRQNCVLLGMFRKSTESIFVEVFNVMKKETPQIVQAV